MWFLALVIVLVLGGVVSTMAKRKGHDPLLWFVYGAAVFPVAIFHVLSTEPNYRHLGKRECPHCYEAIDNRASICPYCRMEVKPVNHQASGAAQTRTSATVGAELQTDTDRQPHTDRWCPAEKKSFHPGVYMTCPVCGQKLT